MISCFYPTCTESYVDYTEGSEAKIAPKRSAKQVHERTQVLWKCTIWKEAKIAVAPTWQFFLERLLGGFKGQRLLEVEQFCTNLWGTHLSSQTSHSLSSHRGRITKKLSTEAAVAPLNYSCFANDKLSENKPILVYLMNDRVEEIATLISGCSWYTWETPFWGIFIFGENT